MSKREHKQIAGIRLWKGVTHKSGKGLF